ncbi:MAG: acyl-CoA thioesterase [Solirubrobacteraceae bacterium]|nr:acyl-CoA thioesterase [Solirubrobacteraceae bacterium]
MSADRRVLFFGDSFVAGVGDPTARGWVGRVAEASCAAGLPFTPYNLGVRRETSADVARRLVAEARPRMRDAAAHGVVICVGANDATVEDGRLRVEPHAAVRALSGMLGDSARLGLSALLVGPAPAGEPAHDERIRELSAAFGVVAARHGVPFADVAGALGANTAWCTEAAAGDGTHPGAGGYAELARLVLAGGWLEWLAGLQDARDA